MSNILEGMAIKVTNALAQQQDENKRLKALNAELYAQLALAVAILSSFKPYATQVSEMRKTLAKVQ